MTGPQHVSEALRRFLSRHEPLLRQMAADEAENGQFTPGLSRCLDLLDQPNHEDGSNSNPGKPEVA